MFRRLPEAQIEVTLFFENQVVAAAVGDSVASALLAAGITIFGINQVSSRPRTPRCLIGNCFECLVEIEGEGRRQACLIPVRNGMRVRKITADEEIVP
ncbi:MAG TPA: (2Fe-2S)-binding protein [Gammaproteobacteria bacterium]|nr:(2Fe-2S)-binding protein [Gammaproteobacteria bacterium]